MKSVTWERWTRDELTQLAYLMLKSTSKGANISDAAKQASRKVNRTWQACVYQYNTNLRSKGMLEVFSQEYKIKMHPVTIAEAVEKMVAPEPRTSKITVHLGSQSHTADILVDTSQILVAKAADVIITIEK